MKKFQPSLINFLRCTIVVALINIFINDANAQQWTFAGCIGDIAGGSSASIAIDNDGNMIVSGFFLDTLLQPIGPLPTGGLQDAYIFKFDSSGLLLWSTILNGLSNDEIRDIAIDDSANIYLAATLVDTVTIDGIQINTTGNSATIIKLSPAGHLIWYIMGDGNSFGRNIALDKTGNVFLAGLVNNTVTFGTLTATNGAGIYNTFILQCNSHTANILNLYMISSSGDYVTSSMVCDSIGNLYLTGVDRPVPNFYNNLFLRRISLNGVGNWTFDMESASGDCVGRSVALDPYGKVYFTGSIYNNVMFNGNQFGNFGRFDNAVLLKYDTSGTLDWARNYGWSGGDRGISLACDDSGNVFWTGSYEDSIIVANDTLYSTDHLWADAFVVKLDSSGNVIWDKLLEGSFDEYPVDLALNQPTSSLALTGTFAVPISFDSLTLNNVDNRDAFFARMSLPSSINVGINSPDNSNDIRIFSDERFLYIESLNEFQSGDFILSDLKGAIIKKGKLNSAINKIDVSIIPQGLYFATIMIENCRISKLIILN